MMNDVKIWASALRLASMPFNLISIFNSLGVLNIGIWGTYSLIIGILMFVIGCYVEWYLK